MKKLLSIILAITISLSIWTVAFATDASLTDIKGHWAEDTIIRWKNQGVISGYPDGTFKPDAPITRAEVSKILTLVFDLPKAESMEYNDLDTSAWYYPYVECAARYIPSYALPIDWKANAPFAAKDGKEFLAEVNAMRMHVAEALVKIKQDNSYNIVALPGFPLIKDLLVETFRDPEFEETFVMHGEVPKNQFRLFQYSYLANELDIMTGDEKGYFRPYDEITRAEFLTVVDRVCKDINIKHTLYHIYLNEDAGYSIKIPDTWNGKYLVEGNAENGLNTVVFKQKATFEKYGEGSGELFYIQKIATSDTSAEMLQGYNREIIYQDDKSFYVLGRPTDVQHPIWIDRDETDVEIAEEYENMYSDIKFIKDSFKIIEDIKPEINTNGVSVLYNDKEMKFENKPFFYKNSIYVPLDEFWSKLGLDTGENNKYTYDNGRIKIQLDGHQDYYEINIGENSVKYDSIDSGAINDIGVAEVRNAPMLLDGVIYTPYDVYALSIFNRDDHFYDVRYIYGDIDSKKSYLGNAEQLTYSNICDIQFDVDNGHSPWRLDAAEVIKMFAEHKNIGGGTIKDLAGTGEKVSADYVLGDIVYDIELFKPVNKSEQGIWIVEKFERSDTKGISKEDTIQFIDSNNDVILNGSDIVRCVKKYEKLNSGSDKEEYFLEIYLNDTGRTKFKDATKRISEMPNGDNYIMICVNNNVISKPTVMAEIDSDSVIVTGNLTKEDVNTLEMIINSAL